METSEILKLKLTGDDFEGVTIKWYLQELLMTLWRDGESFSGKRPFGNSGWEYDLYIPLINAELVKGKLDEYGYVEEFTDEEIKKANQIIFDCIEYVFA